MKKLSVILFFALLLGNAIACEIEFETVGESKNEYAVGDVIVVKSIVTYTHRNCPISIDDTKYDYPGFKVLGATPWKEVKPMIYERKFKLEVIKPVKGKATFSAVRTCKKEGGSGTFTVKVQ